MFYIKNGLVKNDIAMLHEFSEDTIKSDDVLTALFARIKKDSSLFKHSVNVASISAVIGAVYNFNLDELISIYVGSLFHDVGKLNLNNRILYKAGAFTNDERIYTETHTTIGYKLIKDTILNPISIDIVRSHHEKLDGSGYPSSLDRKDIPIYTQIVTVADMFEAMTSDRCYRPALSEDEVYDIMSNDKGINQIAVRILKENIAIREQQFAVCYS